jgi:ABC-2 type transport system permease protein
MIGYGLAHAIERTSLTQLLSQILAFGLLGFTPITYPIENLPSWLGSVHRVLPFYHMGVIVRGGLTKGIVADLGVSYLIVLVWTLIAIGLTALVLGRRK